MEDFWKPPSIKDSSNKQRRVGFEFEFGNLTVRETAEALKDEFGGRIAETNSFLIKLKDSKIGTLKIERDAQLMHSAKHRELLDNLNLAFDFLDLVEEIEHGVDKLSSVIIPCEIVTDPILFTEFQQLDKIVAILNSLEAKGTQASLLYAFGLHINPSTPSLAGETLVAYMQAFLLLADWIIDDSGVDFSRRFFTSYIDPFPSEYRDKILDSKYSVTAETFIEDYLIHNPTRNRALDLLPVLCEIDYDRVVRGVKDGERTLMKSRPAFHYRLPDCRLGDDSWSVSKEWNRWWYVESLAANNDKRFELIDLWTDNTNKKMMDNKSSWVSITRDYLDKNLTPR